MTSERTIHGDEQSIREAMMEFIDEFIEAVMELSEPSMEQAMLLLHGRIPAYPPPRPDQRYIRTGTLGRRITTHVERFDEGVAGEIGAGAPYSPWVIGPDYPGEQINGRMMWQARAFEGRWWQFYEVIDANLQDAWETFEEELFARVSQRLSGS